MKRVCMLGEGAWGTAVSTLLAYNGVEVKLWCHSESVCQSIALSGFNTRVFKDVKLSSLIKPVFSLKEAVTDVDWIFEAIPVKFLRTVVEQCKPFTRPTQKWMILSKGIENETLLFPSQIVDAVLGTTTPKALLLGPSFAQDLLEQQITAVTLAVSDCAFAPELEGILSNNYFKPYLSTDIIGVQVGGAIKNVVAIAIGMLDAAGYSENVKAFMLTRGLHEMVRIAQAVDGRPVTIYGLSGVGDLILTAFSSKSRNFMVGQMLAQGQRLETILKEIGQIPEGVNTAISANQLAKQKNIQLPICQGVYRCLYENMKIDQLIKQIMDQPISFDCVF